MTMTSSWHPAERDQAEDNLARRGTRSALRAALEDGPRDDEFSRHLAAAAALLRSEMTGYRARS
ncbi:MAG TPA: hypothetical protein VGJ19_17355 [Streptosporangiaceae bacterium]|jgi:hypothetical protein